MATSGLLINENNIYGLVNPPPATTAYNPKSWQDPSSGAVRWDQFYDHFKLIFFLFLTIQKRIVWPSRNSEETELVFPSVFFKDSIRTSISSIQPVSHT